MSDRRMIELFFQRSERAIEECARVYGAYLRSIARSIVPDPRDVEECVSDALLRAWETVPPLRPQSLRLYLAKLTRNLAVDRSRLNGALKRGGGEILAELSDTLPSSQSVEGAAEARELKGAVDRFLSSLPARERDVFLMRYWYMRAVPDIAGAMHMSEANVYTVLSRTREKLRLALKKEGYFV